MSRLSVEWDSYEIPSYGFPEFEERKKYGIVGGLGVGDPRGVDAPGVDLSGNQRSRA